jgi:hypothetical protein
MRKSCSARTRIPTQVRIVWHLRSPQVERTWNSAVVCNDTSIVAPVKVLVFRVRALSYEFMRLTRSINPLPSGSRR